VLDIEEIFDGRTGLGATSGYGIGADYWVFAANAVHNFIPIEMRMCAYVDKVEQ
jgi:hypothetical protein